MTSVSPAEGTAGTPPPPGHDELRVPHTRTGAAWALAAVGTFVVLLMLVFILQNGQRTRLNFLWFHGSPPLGAALLLSAVVGAMIVLCLGAGRLLQVRLATRRHRRSVDSG
jgi:lipopolysaccharide assembly protein A